MKRSVLLSPWLLCNIMIQQSLTVLYNTIILSLHLACMVKENDCSLHPFSAQPPQPAHGWVPLSNSSCCTKVQPVCHVRENRLSVDHCQTAKYIASYITRCTVVGQPWGIIILKQCTNCPVKWEEHYILYQTVLPYIVINVPAVCDFNLYSQPMQIVLEWHWLTDELLHYICLILIGRA